MDTLTCMHVDGQLFLPLLAQNLMKQAKTCEAKLPWAYLHLVVSAIPITYQVYCIVLALEVRCGVNLEEAQLLEIKWTINIVKWDMLVICMTCYEFIVIRTMLTWGTFSTQAPSVDIMYFWPWLSNGVKCTGVIKIFWVCIQVRGSIGPPI
jgi:hypothetical protein